MLSFLALAWLLEKGELSPKLDPYSVKLLEDLASL